MLNHDVGRVNDDGHAIDEQTPRIAYTVNEALCPRNKSSSGSRALLDLDICLAHMPTGQGLNGLDSESAPQMHAMRGVTKP